MKDFSFTVYSLVLLICTVSISFGTSIPKLKNGCLYKGRYYQEGATVTREKTGSWCYGFFCKMGSLVPWDDFNCVDQTPLLQQLPQQIPLFQQTPHHLGLLAYILVNTIEMDQWLQTINMVHGVMAYFVKVVTWCIGIISTVEPQRYSQLHKPQLHPQHLQQSQCKQHNICTYFLATGQGIQEWTKVKFVDNSL